MIDMGFDNEDLCSKIVSEHEDSCKGSRFWSSLPRKIPYSPIFDVLIFTPQASVLLSIFPLSFFLL
jgi:hypothetical protein